MNLQDKELNVKFSVLDARKIEKKPQEPCMCEVRMYREEDKNQLELENFYMLFGWHLDEENRWVVLGKKILWTELEYDYKNNLSSSELGAPGKSLRMALGALIIKERFQISDREVVEQIRENHYLQYLIGLEGFEDKESFDASMIVHFRKRLNRQLLEKV